MLNKKLFIVICIFLVIVFLGLGTYMFFSKKNIDFSGQLPFEFELIKYVDGEFSEKTIVGEGSKDYEWLKYWFVNNNEGWAMDFVTYAPESLYQSESIKVNVTFDMVVVNYEKDGHWSQVSNKREK